MWDALLRSGGQTDRGRRQHELALSLLDFGRRDLPQRHWWWLSGGVHITAVGSWRQLPEKPCYVLMLNLGLGGAIA